MMAKIKTGSGRSGSLEVWTSGPELGLHRGSLGESVILFIAKEFNAERVTGL